ncbi:hypothetical protein JHK82_053015 [Glycine max]|uniref:1-phosphatidylinositol-4-phosphate 5-kinase n=1 Tax=Glycine max TaxID=3847 RepID=K7MXC6_SOYBN|nr:hypothetical protein JHK86_052860 [Glycine max]KAG4927232.1 hypothetical protein JHK85_053718 [Glycine max]KAG5082850.1 hypothetical protein JHK84_052888 [Glycine max]KAG5085618.1 hypothetical protein JHK82_053015 [Glycine max]
MILVQYKDDQLKTMILLNHVLFLWIDDIHDNNCNFAKFSVLNLILAWLLFPLNFFYILCLIHISSFFRKSLIRLGANMPARAERMARRSDFDQYTPCCSGETYDVVIYCGIIDILQDYDISKKLEHAYKSLQVDPSSISIVDPKLYSKRFRDFVGRIFIEDW